MKPIILLSLQQNEFCIDKIIKRCPLKCGKSILSSEMQTRLRELIDSKTSLPHIAQAIGLIDDAVIIEIVILLRSGYSITKNHLMHLVGVDDSIFNHITTLAAPGDFHCLDAIDTIKAKFCTNTKITEHMLVLVLNYLKVRQYLKLTNVPYFDPDENKLMNAKALIGNYGDKTPFDATATHNAAIDLSMDGNEFDDDMIDKIFIEWGPEEADKHTSKEIEQVKIAAPPMKPIAIISPSKAHSQLVHDVSVEEVIDEEMIENIFVDWSPNDAEKTKIEALHETNIKHDIPKSSMEIADVSAPIEAKKQKVTAPRVFVRPKTHVKYCSDSDSEEENQPAAVKPQRSLPNWMAQRPVSTAPGKEKTDAKRMKRAKF